MLQRIKLLAIMAIMSLMAWAQEPMLIENYAKPTYAEYNVTQNGQLGLMLHMNARTVDLEGKRVETGVLFFSNSQMGNDGLPVFIDAQCNTYKISSWEQSLNDVKVFVPYQDYIFDCHGACYIKNVTNDEIVYINFDELFRPETNKIRAQSSAKDEKFSFRATQFITEINGQMSDRIPCNYILTHYISKGVFEIRDGSESVVYRIDNIEDNGADAELSMSKTYYVTDSTGEHATIDFDAERSGNMYFTLNRSRGSMMFLVDFAN